MTKLLRSQPISNDFGILLLRVIFGCLFISHGYAKIISYNQIAPHFPDLIGIGGKLSFVLVIFAEFFCGFFVLIGLLTRLAVIPILITMVVAYFMALKGQEFKLRELPFAYMFISLVIFVFGSGKYSVDKLLLKK